MDYNSSIEILVKNYNAQLQIMSVDEVAIAGSGRRNYRVKTNEGNFIATYHEQESENKLFIKLSEFLAACNLPVTTIYYVGKNVTWYLQKDLGAKCLLDVVLENGWNENTIELYKNAISHLVNFHSIKASELQDKINEHLPSFDYHRILADLFYFKNNFLAINNIEFKEEVLISELGNLANRIQMPAKPMLMYRDYQGRNILIQNKELNLIDYQGLMIGHPLYDMVSLLWQAKAQMPKEIKIGLLEYYFELAIEKLNLSQLDLIQWRQDYNLLTLVRLLQVLGAYGLRGLQEGKSHFISSIPQGIENIREWMQNKPTEFNFPELEKILTELTIETFIQKFKLNIMSNKLTIHVCSFSYKEGIPVDDSGNGGGYVFDCRGILNPGRIEEYKKQTGRDQAVIDYLENETRIQEFLDSIYRVVSITVEDYLARGFENLSICFGCTGGQHRSVYSANAMAKYLQEKYPVNINLKHVVQERKNWVND